MIHPELYDVFKFSDDELEAKLSKVGSPPASEKALIKACGRQVGKNRWITEYGEFMKRVADVRWEVLSRLRKSIFAVMGKTKSPAAVRELFLINPVFKLKTEKDVDKQLFDKNGKIMWTLSEIYPFLHESVVGDPTVPETLGRRFTKYVRIYSVCGRGKSGQFSGACALDVRFDLLKKTFIENPESDEQARWLIQNGNTIHRFGELFEGLSVQQKADILDLLDGNPRVLKNLEAIVKSTDNKKGKS